MLLVGGGLAYLFPLCVPCLAVVAGALAGYLAGVWERPADNGRAVQRGALAGAIGGVGANNPTGTGQGDGCAQQSDFGRQRA